jgi:outer membrane protein assembly factor BamB
VAQALKRRISLQAQGRLGENLEIAKSLEVAAVVLLLTSCAPSSSSQSQPGQPAWTMYRGDLARDGHPPGATLDPAGAQRLGLAWRAHLDGAVDGSPAIAGGLVIAASAGGELAAFDPVTGKVVWDQTGLGPMSDSPAVASGRVFVGTLTGHVRAFALAGGDPLWDWTAPGDQPAIWASPAVYGDLVVIGSASPYGDIPLEPGRLFGLEAQTGRQVWGTCVRTGCQAGDGIWSTSSIDSHGVAFVGVGNPEDGVMAFGPATGLVFWERSLNPDEGRDLDVGASPVIIEYRGREALAVSSVSGMFALLDALSGAVIWSRNLVSGSAVHGLIATPAYDGGILYIPSASPPTGMFALTPDGATVWSHVTDLPIYSSPAIARDVVIFGTGAVFGDLGSGSLVALEGKNGHTLWSYDVHSAVRSSPAVAGTLVVAGAYSGDVLAFRPSS